MIPIRRKIFERKKNSVKRIERNRKTQVIKNLSLWGVLIVIKQGRLSGEYFFLIHGTMA